MPLFKKISSVYFILFCIYLDYFIIIIVLIVCVPVCMCVCVCVCVCVLSGDYHLVMVERLACSCDPKSNTVWSYTPDRVTHGGKDKGEVLWQWAIQPRPQRQYRQRMMAGLTGASQRLLMQIKAAAERGPHSSWTPCHWILTPFCQGSYGDCLCTSLPTLNKITHSRLPWETTLTSWSKSYGDQRVVTGVGLWDLEAPIHKLAH